MITPSRPKSRREILSEGITEEVRAAIREEMAGAEPPLNEKEYAGIEAEILSHTTRVLEALTCAEMGSEGALVLHVRQARVEANRLIRRGDNMSKRRCD